MAPVRRPTPDRPGPACDQLATETGPSALPDSDGAQFGPDVHKARWTGQCHTAEATTPSRYVEAGDSATFKALVRQAQGLRATTSSSRCRWPLARQRAVRSTANRRAAAHPHPMAVMLGAQESIRYRCRQRQFPPYANTASRRLRFSIHPWSLWRKELPNCQRDATPSTPCGRPRCWGCLLRPRNHSCLSDVLPSHERRRITATVIEVGAPGLRTWPQYAPGRCC